MMKKLFSALQARVQGILYAFAALADFDQSSKLSQLYRPNQDLPTYLNSIFKVAISAGAIIAVLRLSYAGYMYMGSDLWHNKERAKEIIRDVFLGIFLLLSVYIILYQINPNLLNLKVSITPLLPPAITTTPSASQEKLNAIIADEQRVRDLILNTNQRITIKNLGCTSLSQTSGCTSVGLLNPRAITNLNILQNGCNCDVVITGGTEFWMHASHQPGLAIVDLRADSGLNQYLTGSGTAPTSNVTVMKNGVYFTYETLGSTENNSGAHWHATL